jgi:hypothetical protein
MRTFFESKLKLLILVVAVASGIAVLTGAYRTVPTAAAPPAMARGNPEARVWVDRSFGLYYCSDSAAYRHLWPGEEMTQAQAQAKSFRPALGLPCR